MTRSILLSILLLAAAADAQEYGVTKRMKITIGGSNRKLVFFLPRNLKKNESLPLLVAVPDTRGQSYYEVGQWSQQAFDHRFAIFSVDIKSSGMEGWSPRDQLVMARDIEAVVDGMKMGIEWAEKNGARIDRSAIVITGHSGGTYLALWLGLRRPDLFLAVSGRSCVFHKETVEFGKLDVKPDFNQRLFIFRGELDHPRAIEQTDMAHRTLLKAGYRNVKYEVVEKMTHESKPAVFLEWFYAVLKETSRGRAEARRIAKELVKVMEAIRKKRAGAYGKLQKLVVRENKAGFSAGATTQMAKVLKVANKRYRDAEDAEANHDFAGALTTLKSIERAYSGLAIAKKARKFASRIRKSKGFQAAELLAKAKALKAKGKDVKAAELFEKIMNKYPETAAADEADRLLRG